MHRSAPYADTNEIKKKYLVLEAFSIFDVSDTFETIFPYRAWFYREGAKIKTRIIKLSSSKLVKEI